MELVLERVGHRYGTLVAVEDVSLRIRAGRVLALVGPSGCGKSTLLGLMGGLLRPGAGRVLAEGAPGPDCLNPVSYVFQDFALLPWRSAAGNVALALEHHPLTPAERGRRVDRALALTGLAEFRDALPRQLSGGMRQRVGIARAVATAPSILLMDEPLSALDAQTRTLLMEDLEAIWQAERTTAVYVTHNLDEAIRLADEIAVLSRRPGRLKSVLPVPVPRGAREEPAHARALAELRAALWRSIRDEARSAERETLDDARPH